MHIIYVFVIQAIDNTFQSKKYGQQSFCLQEIRFVIHVMYYFCKESNQSFLKRVNNLLKLLDIVIPRSWVRFICNVTHIFNCI